MNQLRTQRNSNFNHCKINMINTTKRHFAEKTHDTRCYLQDNKLPRTKQDAEQNFGAKSTKSINRNQTGIMINKHGSQVATEAVNYIIT